MHMCRYGSYEMSNDPYLSANRLSLIDRGFIFAVAHVRGGGEMGRQWYEDGKYLHKKNTFTDFIACAEHLVKEKYTSPKHLCIEVSVTWADRAVRIDKGCRAAVVKTCMVECVSEGRDIAGCG